MKKFTIIALALCMSFMLAAPAMAVDANFSGYYFVRGSYVSHWNLDDKSASNAYMDMKFRLKTVFKVSDILSVTTRFDALDERVWGTDATSAAANNIAWDRAYMTIKAPIGTFDVGRLASGAWGTSFIDTASQADRIKYVKKIDNLTLYAIFQKDTESDNAVATTAVDEDAAVCPCVEEVTATPDEADKDKDTYYLIGKYKAESTTAGLLLAFTNDKTTSTQTTYTYVANPYFVSKFGPLAIQGELAYKWGQTDYDDTTADLDIKKLAYNLEATYNIGPASIMAGYAFISGDGDSADNETKAYGDVGDDWAKLFILTGSDVGVLNDLGGTTVGNLSKSGTGADPAGAKIIYGGATFSPLENLKLGVVVGKADADKLRTGYSKDDYGVEYDFTLNWKIYDNLTYSAVAAFLSAGDFYKERSTDGLASTTFDDTYALFHQLELAF
jgi:hypothetical protein